VADRVDVAIVGGGIVGLATAHLLLEARPDLRVAVLEKEPELATHQSGHNSGVIHAGLYYAPGSLKATLCREGKAKLERFAGERGIPFRHPGKLVVALNDSERPRLEALCERASANGVEGLEVLGPERMRELEPHVAGVQALWSPKTGIIAFRTVALAYADEARSHGADIQVDRAVTSIDERGDGVVIGTTRGELEATNVIACAGLQSDRVSAMTGERGPDVPRGGPLHGHR
jgi:L-2-hydroxyglutarate oxidase